ncbi:helix-turn-helix domain-containing protein [Kribbella turkmenica]|uniref:helix-turn-helix domain-containing protein n=1 Tax=Kribbella turkmenica TaxID=2530375 RepID=UPI0014046C00|nr:helix-turn-helix transcriptional regulator [Kribbella turkmenica]
MRNWSIYLTPGHSERQLGLFCLGAGEQENRPGPTPERALGCHALVWIKEGHGHLLHGPDRQLFDVQAPAMLWLHPGVLHGYRPATRWRQAWALFSGPATTALTTLGHLDPTEPVRRYADPRTVDRAFTRLLRVSATRNAVQTVAALYDLVAQAAPPPDDDIAAQLAGLACKALSIQDYAAELGLNVKELRDAVRRTTGSTPQELVLTTRLNTAKALLAEEELSVGAVARRVGYDDPAYFTRLFTARVGLSPRAFRRSGSIPTPFSSF